MNITRSINKAPVSGKRNILITSALPYSNATPHLGNIIGCVLSADVYARFVRQRGYNSLYICGTDEYGTATEFKALQENCSPREICDRFHKVHSDIYRWFEIDFDHFGRTSTDLQTKICTDIFQKLERNGLITEKPTRQFQCEHCSRFLADRFVEGVCPVCASPGARGDQCDACSAIYEASELTAPRCKCCGGPAAETESPELFLEIKKLVPRLQSWVAAAAEQWSENTAAVTRAWLPKIDARCITRNLRWGTPVPREGFERKVFYVWFDAPIGYLSITAAATERWEEWWKSDDVELCQFMGKDNITFHTLIFPATLMGTGDSYTLAKRISTTEHLLYEGGKFSKSQARGVFGDEARDSGVPAAVWRYYLVATRPEVADANFRWADLATKNNAELNNNLGNLVCRVLSFAKANFGGKVPPLDRGVLEKADFDFVDALDEVYREYLREMESIRLKSGLKLAMKASNMANTYFQNKEPWAKLKGTAEDRKKCAAAINVCGQALRLLSALLSPFMPSVSEKIERQANFARFSLESRGFELEGQSEGKEIGEVTPLFEKIPPAAVAAFEARFSGHAEKAFPLDLIVGRVESVEEHPTAADLFVLNVCLGLNFKKRIVSALRRHYAPNEVLGKKVVVVNNVKKAKVEGVNSYGMIVCARRGDEMCFVTADAEVGLRAAPQRPGAVAVKKNFNYKREWAALGLKCNEGAVCEFAGQPLCAGGALLVADAGFGGCELV